MKVRRLHFFLFIVGLICLLWMLHTVGVGGVWNGIKSLRWGLIPFVLLEGIGEVMHAEGWRCCLSGHACSISRGRLFWSRLAGYSINYFTPTAAMGGEVVRASLITESGGAADAASSVLIDKVCYATAHLTWVLIGVFLIGGYVKIPAAWRDTMLVSCSLVSFGILSFGLIQKNGKIGSILRWLVSRNIGGQQVYRLSNSLSSVDDSFRIFYRDRKRDLSYAFGWHLVGISMGFFQTWLFFSLRHQRISPLLMLNIWVIGLWFDLVSFLIPMNIGSLEASRMFTFIAYGFRAVEGLTYGMLLRLAQIAWAVTGLVGYAFLTLFQVDRSK